MRSVSAVDIPKQAIKTEPLATLKLPLEPASLRLPESFTLAQENLKPKRVEQGAEPIPVPGALPKNDPQVVEVRRKCIAAIKAANDTCNEEITPLCVKLYGIDMHAFEKNAESAMEKFNASANALDTAEMKKLNKTLDEIRPLLSGEEAKPETDDQVLDIYRRKLVAATGVNPEQIAFPPKGLTPEGLDYVAVELRMRLVVHRLQEWEFEYCSASKGYLGSKGDPLSLPEGLTQEGKLRMEAYIARKWNGDPVLAGARRDEIAAQYGGLISTGENDCRKKHSPDPIYEAYKNYGAFRSAEAEVNDAMVIASRKGIELAKRLQDPQETNPTVLKIRDKFKERAKTIGKAIGDAQAELNAMGAPLLTREDLHKYLFPN